MCRPQGYTFRTSSLARVYFLAILVVFSQARVCFVALLIEFSPGKGLLFGNFSRV